MNKKILEAMNYNGVENIGENDNLQLEKRRMHIAGRTQFSYPCIGCHAFDNFVHRNNDLMFIERQQ
jgi:hypothetical protein